MTFPPPPPSPSPSPTPTPTPPPSPTPAPTPTPTPTPPAICDLSEKAWTGQVVELARLLNWHRYHTHRSTRSEAGWPDEALVRDRLILLELKTETGRLSRPQREWLTMLRAAGVEAYIARPSQLEDVAAVLTSRHRTVNSLDLATAAELEPP